MEKINLTNMPNGELYLFAPNRYVWKILRAGGTRDGNYLRNSNEVSEYTEVFSVVNNGNISCEWSGRFHANPALTDENGLDSESCFYIFSYDQDCGAKFQQEHDLIKAPLEIQTQALNQEKEVISYIQNKLRELNNGRKY